MARVAIIHNNFLAAEEAAGNLTSHENQIYAIGQNVPAEEQIAEWATDRDIAICMLQLETERETIAMTETVTKSIRSRSPGTWILWLTPKYLEHLDSGRAMGIDFIWPTNDLQYELLDEQVGKLTFPRPEDGSHTLDNPYDRRGESLKPNLLERM